MTSLPTGLPQKTADSGPAPPARTAEPLGHQPSGREDAAPEQPVRGQAVPGPAMDRDGAALLEAREQAGAEAFDAAVRCYVQAAAWRIAAPEDVAAALADLPAALDVLTGAGALPAG